MLMRYTPARLSTRACAASMRADRNPYVPARDTDATRMQEMRPGALALVSSLRLPPLGMAAASLRHPRSVCVIIRL